MKKASLTKFLAIVNLGIFFLHLTSGTAQASDKAARSTDQVWSAHIDAWQDRDLSGILADYDEESLLILNNKVFRGPSEIRQVFERLFAIFDNGVNEIDPPTVDGRIVFITWNFSPNSLGESYYGTDTFVIEKGVIAIQTIASPLYDVFF